MKKENSQIRLKRIMDERGLRQVDILRMSEPWQKKLDIKISKNTLSQYLNGISSPDNYKATLLAKTLGVNEAWLLGYDVPRNDEEKATKSTVKSPIIDETIKTMELLEEPRQKIILETAKIQLEDQNKLQEERNKIISLQKEQPIDDDMVWKYIASSGGRPFTEEDKQATRELFADKWDEIVQKAKDLDSKK